MITAVIKDTALHCTALVLSNTTIPTVLLRSAKSRGDRWDFRRTIALYHLPEDSDLEVEPLIASLSLEPLVRSFFPYLPELRTASWKIKIEYMKEQVRIRGAEKRGGWKIRGRGIYYGRHSISLCLSVFLSLSPSLSLIFSLYLLISLIFIVVLIFIHFLSFSFFLFIFSLSYLYRWQRSGPNIFWLISDFHIRFWVLK